MANKKIFTIEELSIPLVQYKYDGALRDHLATYAADKQFGALPIQYLDLSPDEDMFWNDFEDALHQAIIDESESHDEFDDLHILDIVPIMPKIEAGTSSPKTEVTKYQFEFDAKQTDIYGASRKAASLLNWDAIAVAFAEEMEVRISGQEGYCADSEAWTPNSTQSEPAYDARWIDLYQQTFCDKDSKYADEYCYGAKYATFKLDEIIRKAAAVKGRQWKNYCKHHDLPVAYEALDFMCWVLDHHYNFDVFLYEIGIVYDPYTEIARPEYDTDIFASTPTPTPTPTQTSNNNTTMAQTTNIPSGWKAQPANSQMTASEYEALYFDRFFKEQLSKVKLDAEGHSILDLPCDRIWNCNDKGSIITITFKTEGFESMHSYDLANNGSRNNSSVIGGVKYMWISLAKMAEAILKFNGETAPDDIQNYIKNKLGGKATAPKARTKHTPKGAATAPTAPTSVETSTPRNIDTPAIAPTAPEAEVYHHAAGNSYYYCAADGDAVRIIAINGADWSVDKDLVCDAEKIRGWVKSYGMTLVDMPEAMRLALIKYGAISAMSVAPTAAPEPTAEIFAKKEEAAPAAEQSAPTAESAPEEATAESAPAEVVPFTLPGAITISDVKNGSLTLNGLTDLTAEQVSIFVAGMNAMREAIKKQMEAI